LREFYDLGDTVCDKTSYKSLLSDKLVGDNLKVDLLGGAAGNYFYLPQNTPEGNGTEKLLHMTYVFQIFVFMQIFNQMNARLLTGDINIFSGICRNMLFIGG
jgi:hypothetical protein